MRRHIAVKPAETLVMNFPDGSFKEAVFNIEALITLTEEFGGISKMAKTFHGRPYEMAARILYSGMKILDASVTLEEARALMIGGGIPLMADIMEMFQESFGAIDPEELKKNLIPTINSQIARRKPWKKRKRK